MNKIKIDKVIVVEGKYDKIKLSEIVDGIIITTNGFEIFTNKEKQKLIRMLSKKSGIIVLTDSDVAGFRIRRFINSIVDTDTIYHAYIPDVFGKERRKLKPSKEGKLGVEGINADTLREVFKNAENSQEKADVEVNKRKITKMDFYNDGLTGSADSTVKRQKLIRYFGLPEHLTTNSLIDILNKITDYDEYKNAVENL